MAITAVDKVKINKYLKEHAMGDIYYLELCDALGKRKKISDNEFLEYFVESIICEFRKNEKISINYLLKIISVVEAFIGFMHKDDSNINEDILNKIRSFKDLYEDYLSRSNFDVDNNLMYDSINSVLKVVNELYPSEVKTDCYVKYINKISELEEQLKKMNKKNDDATKSYDRLQKENTQKNSDICSLNKEIVLLNRDNEGKNNLIIQLNETTDLLNTKINQLETLLAHEKEEKNELVSYKAQYEKLIFEIEDLRKKCEDYTLQKTSEDNLKLKQLKLESLIYKKILLENSSIDDILKCATEDGLVSSREEIYSLLQRMKSIINIDYGTFSLNPTYKVSEANVSQGQQFSIDIPNGCKYYDIMLVSDFHIKDFNHNILIGFDFLYDYCAKNGINLILNLGDFYHGFGHTLDYDKAVNVYKTVEQSVSSIPKVDNLYHAILGGNHDRNITKYGFDPLSLLSSQREDIINLGYNYSNIQLNNSQNILGMFGIHHPDSFDFPIELNEDGIDITKIDKYLNDIYNKYGKNRNKSYIDIFGHTHRSQFNYLSAYYYLPAYFDGKMDKRACHLRIYFDVDTEIKYMVFMPLIFKKGLVKNDEIIYRKSLSNKKI